MQVPRPEKDTVFPETEQTPLLLGSVVNTTVRPEVAVATIVYGGSFLSTCGGVDVMLIVCEALATVNDCCTCAAAWYVPLPAWFAFTVHVPAPIIVTVVPETVQTPALAGAMENATARPELAVAVTMYVDPPTVALPGGLDV